LVEVLLGAGADPRARGCFGRELQPIHRAAQWSARLVQRLVAAGAPIDGDVAGHSTLCAAAGARTARGVRIIPTLVALGARETGGNNALFDFAFYPVKEGVQPSDGEVAAALAALVSVGCSLTQPNRRRMRPIVIAAQMGNAPVVRALLSMGVVATTNSLIHAVMHPDTVRLLLAAGAPVNARARFSGKCVTPLMRAAHTSSLESVQLLLAAGASLAQFGKNELTYAITSLVDDSSAASGFAVMSVVDAMLRAGARVSDDADHLGDSLLHCVARMTARPWACDVARLLLDYGAGVGATNIDGMTPIECVEGEPRGDAMRVLLLGAAEAANA
jgi:ankyrin repeat protein